MRIVFLAAFAILWQVTHVWSMQVFLPAVRSDISKFEIVEESPIMSMIGIFNTLLFGWYVHVKPLPVFAVKYSRLCYLRMQAVVPNIEPHWPRQT